MPTAPVSVKCSVGDAYFVFERNTSNALAFFSVPDVDYVVAQSEDDVYIAFSEGMPVLAFSPEAKKGLILNELAICEDIRKEF
jgi:hypothetical protein